MGSSDNLSFPSEPPDIGNWFSSYAYESPELNSIDDFKDCHEFKRNDSESSKKEKEAVANVEEPSSGYVQCEKFNGGKKFRCEDTGSSQYLSLYSEPPDIKRWFSSYEYESPALDSSTDFGNLDYDCSPGGVKETDAAKNTEEKELDCLKAARPDLVSQDAASTGLVECVTSVEDNKNEGRHISKPTHESDGNKDSTGNPKRQRENRANGSIDELQSNKATSDGSLKKRLCIERSPRRFGINKDSSHNGGSSPGRLIFGSESLQTKYSTDVITIVTPQGSSEFTSMANGMHSKEAPGGSHEKEKCENEITENGFISTKRSKCRLANDENNLQRPCCQSLFRKAALSTKEDATIRRNALSDTTNFQHPTVPEMTGKWKCPQKNKPNRGPPLKQLRLENWVHRA